MRALRFRVFQRRVFQLGLTLALAVSLASCGGDEPPPEGFHIELRLMSLDPSVLDELRLRFEPQGTGEMFFVEPMSFADGAINISMDADARSLLMTISGENVAAFAVDQGDGSFVYDLELWSNDMTARTRPPGVRVIGLRAGEQIAEGFLFLPQWPLPLGNRSVVNVPCRMAVSDRCVP